MKTLLFVFVLSFLTFGCKKEEPAVAEQPQLAQPPPEVVHPPIDTVAIPRESADGSLIPPHARRSVGKTDINLLRTHASAAKIYLSLPDSQLLAPVPPESRPFRNPKLKKYDGKTAFYTFETANGRTGDMLLLRHAYKADTIWIPMHILPK